MKPCHYPLLVAAALTITVYGGVQKGIGQVVLAGETGALERQQHERVDTEDQERLNAGSVSVD